MSVIHVAAPLRVRERLLAATDGPREVVHRSAQAIYVDLDGLVVGLVGAGATRVPCALWSRLTDLTPVPERAAIRRGALVLGDEPVRIGRLVDVRLPRPVPGAAPRHREPSSPQPFAPTAPLTAATVEALVGRGPGLTPYGDDLVAGWSVVHAAAGTLDPATAAAVRRLLPRTTLVSATLLACALHGEAPPELRAWLIALGTDDEAAAADRLLAVGATSGLGLMTGARLALESLAPGRLSPTTTLRRTA